MAKKQEVDQANLPSAQSVANGLFSEHGDSTFGNAGFGASYDFAGKDIDRYLTYGSETYGKLGYDPFRDNAEFYNQNTSAGADLQRAWTGMWKLAGVGFRDTFAFGATASDDAHKEFKQVMDNYGSTRKGTAGFISNTMLSSGYTVGIMGAIAAEELMLAATTALSGGAGAPLTVGEMGAVGARGFTLLNKAQKVVKGFDKVTDALDYAKNIEGARTLWMANQSKSFIKKLAPLGETFDFIRNADKLKDLNGLQKTLSGVGSFARDVRKIHLTNSESKLEANLAKDEFKEELIREWESDPAHVGMTMDTKTLDDINGKAQNVFDDTYKGNLGLIYATNAITWNAMFSSMRGVNRMFNLHNSLKYTVNRMAGKKVSVTALENTFGTRVKQEVSKLTWKGTAKKTLEASVEGFQEIGQDAISGTAKLYSGFGDNPKLEGSFLDSFYTSLGDVHAESFFSGMLMGTFASPVGKTIQAVNKFTVGGGYRAVSDPLGYESAKKSRYEDAVKKAEILEKFFNDSGSYSDFADKTVFAQSLSAEQMTEAGEKGDRKSFEDKRAETFRSGLHTALEAGMEGELLDYLDDLGNYTSEELNQAMNRSDITDDNRGETMQRVENYKKTVKSYKEKYDRINKDFVNPVAIQSLSAEDPEFLKKKLIYHANEKFKKELLFSEGRLEDLAERQKVLYGNLTDNKFTTTALNTILTNEDIDTEIKSLTEELKSDKEYGTDSDNSQKKAQLESLKKFKASVKKYDALGVDIDETKAVYDEMFEAFNEYRNTFTGESNTTGNRVQNKKKFQELWDYLNLRGESDVLQEFVNTMNDPISAATHVDRINSRLTYQENNKKALIEKSLKAFYAKQSSDEMIADLLKSDVIFDHSELDDLIEKGIMPRKLYNLSTHKELKGAELKAAQDIIARHHENLTGKKITASDKGYATRKKSKSDTRTASELFTEYGKNGKGVSIETFVKKLLRSKKIGNTEAEILNTLLGTGALKDVSIILTDDGDTPIDVNENGDIVIDVRFSSEDFEDGNISFEYLGVSALLQTYFTNQLDTNKDLKRAITSMMEDAKEATLDREGETLNRATINNIPVFKNPAVFLSEALNNSAFQDLLRQVEDTTDAEGQNLWAALREQVSSELDSKFEGGLLNRAIDLAYLTITDKDLSEQATEEKVTVIPKADTGELSDVERTQNQIKETETTLKALRAEVSKTKRIKFRKYNQLVTRISKLDLELADLNQQLVDQKEAEVIRESAPVKPNHEVTTPVEEMDGSIHGGTAFLSLPMDLQIILADIHLRNTDVETTEDGGIITDNIDSNGGISANNDFDAGDIGINLEEKVNSLTEEDINQIQANMLNNVSYIEAIAQYNNSVPKEVKAEKVEDQVDEAPETEYQPITSSDLISFFPTIKDVMSERKIQNRAEKLNSLTSQKEISKFINSIALELAKLESATPEVEVTEEEQEDLDVKVENWKSNKQSLESRSFIFNGERFSVPQVDVKYFLNQHPRILYADTQDFVKALYEFKNNSVAYSTSLKTNPPSIQANDKAAVRSYVDMLLNSQVVSSKVARTLNDWLVDQKSPYTLKFQNDRVVVTERKGKYTKPVSKSQKLEQDLKDHFLRFGETIVSITQVEFMIYDFIRENKLHPSITNEKRSYTSSDSTFISADGIANAIFDNLQEEQIERLEKEGRNIVDEMISSFDTITEMREYLVNEMVNEKNAENQYTDSAAETELAELEDMQMEDAALAEYYKSAVYLISNDGYTGDLNALTTEERNLYDLIQAVKVSKTKQVETRATELFNQMQSEGIDSTQYDYINNVTIALKASDISLKDTVALYSLINNPLNNLTPKQRSFVNTLIGKRLHSVDFQGEVVVSDDSIMRIINANGGNIILQRLDNGKVVSMNSFDLAGSITAVLESGTEYDPSGFDNKLDDDNAKDLSTAIGEIFNNFTESMDEFKSMNETTLMNSIVEELNKC